MYHFLDRRVAGIDPTLRFLLSAMRLWAAAIGDDHLHQAPVARAFAGTGAIEGAGDFAIAMRTLEDDAAWTLRLGAPGSGAITDDEARLLALWEAGLAGDPRRIRRLAAALVSNDGAGRLATAVELASARITDGVFVERDR